MEGSFKTLYLSRQTVGGIGGRAFQSWTPERDGDVTPIELTIFLVECFPHREAKKVPGNHPDQKAKYHGSYDLCLGELVRSRAEYEHNGCEDCKHRQSPTHDPGPPYVALFALCSYLEPSLSAFFVLVACDASMLRSALKIFHGARGDEPPDLCTDFELVEKRLKGRTIWRPWKSCRKTERPRSSHLREPISRSHPNG